MAKTYLSHAKYIIHQKFTIKGIVDKHDIIGAIFGQSEGIIGEDLDIRELQGSGKIGRIEIEQNSINGVTTGTLIIPSGADMVETSILAATTEIVDKVGPCDAHFETIKIEDTRITKRKMIIDRAKELLSKLINEEIPDSAEITYEVKSEVRTAGLKEYGPDKLASGPHIDDSEEVIVVEGRADVVNLLKYNIKNAIAMGGSKIPQTIWDLSKRKTIIAFLDGDRGGDLNLKKLLQVASVDFIAKAPTGKEVEELTKKEILACLNKKIPVVQTKEDDDKIDLASDRYWEPKDDDFFDATDIEDNENTKKPNVINKIVHNNYNRNNKNYKNGRNQYNSQTNHRRKESNNSRNSTRTIVNKSVKPVEAIKPVKPKTISTEVDLKDLKVDYKKEMGELKNKLKARIYNKKGEKIAELPVRDILKKLKETKDINIIIFDGIITKRLAETSKSKGIKYLIGTKKGKMSKIKGIELIEYKA